jgi:hypothetical protein
MKALPILALVLLAAGCATAAPAPAAPAPLDPAGRYEFTTTAQGQAVDGAIVLTGTPGAYRGTITTNLTPDIPVTRVAVEGRELHVAGEMPDGPITMVLVLDDEGAFTGSWEFGGMAGEMVGRRTP